MEKAISDGANNVNEEDVSKLKQEIIEMSENYYENRAALKKKSKKIYLITFLIWYVLFIILLGMPIIAQASFYITIAVMTGVIAVAISKAVIEISCLNTKKETERFKHRIISDKLKYKKMLKEG